VRKSTYFSAAPGFFEYTETTRLWPPRMAALPPPSNCGNGMTLNLPATLVPFFCPSEYAYGQLRMNVARPDSK
jgi:hypothetical protein